MPQKTVAVIGGGASGTLVCARLADLGVDLSIDLVIEWIGNEGEFGRGLAYGTREPSHLLNVPAGKMSAFAERPGHFLEWLGKHHPELGAQAGTFVPRMIYGEYLSQLLPAQLAPSKGAPGLRRRLDEAIAVEKKGDWYRVSLASGAEVLADEVVLALGALSSLPGKSEYGALRPSELGRVPADARVLLIGSGLTMIDAMLSLRARGHSAPVMALSRHGLLPHAHATGGAYSPTPAFHSLVTSRPTRLSRALRDFRTECRAAEERGASWREVFDELRPRTVELWQKLTPAQKRAFYRHIRPYWDIHRHRIAPWVHEQLQGFLRSGMLEVAAARILKIEKTGECFQVRFRPRGASRDRMETFDAIVDCTGFFSEVTALQSPILHSAIRQGLIAVDDPPLGISPRPSEHPSGHSGVHVIGPLLRASLWETIAIPEIRVQAAQIAERITSKSAAGGKR